MKTSSIALGVIAFLVIIFGMNGCSSYNNMTKMDVDVTNSWAQVQTEYQRRSDLIPNLVAVVKNYADFEKSTLEGVIAARAKATSVTIDASKLDAASMEKFQQTQGALSSSLSRLIAVAESYPNLKANENFTNLQTQLEGSENRIGTARKDYNETVKIYDSAIRMFPRNIWAGVFNFHEKPFFQADPGSDKAPDVSKEFKK
jgi:LemA protein